MNSSNHHFWLSAFIPETIKETLPTSFPPLPDITSVSLSERIPSWLLYLPMAFYWLVLSCCYRSFTLPCLANPDIPFAGIANESKSEILNNFTPTNHLPKNCLIQHTNKLTPESLLATMNHAGLKFPIIAKPDMGCAGIGLKLLNNHDALYHAICAYPLGEKIILNEFIEWPEELGVFYIKIPGKIQGFVPSLTLKYPFLIAGDGKRTVEEHLKSNSAGRRVLQQCRQHHRDVLQKIIPKHTFFRVTIFGSHTLGTIFRNGSSFIDDALCQRVNLLAQGLPNFYFGRFDIKCRSLNDFKAGKNFKVLEINAASAEMTHIWDPEGSLLETWSALIQQISFLFKIGHEIRKTGRIPPKLHTVITEIRTEFARKKKYPL